MARIESAALSGGDDREEKCGRPRTLSRTADSLRYQNRQNAAGHHRDRPFCFPFFTAVDFVDAVDIYRVLTEDTGWA
jgi:hypothetical protein